MSKTRVTVEQKLAARAAVKNAVARGDLVRPKMCPECGGTEKRIEAHHHDYTKPLDVQWLCSACHGLAHRKCPGAAPTPRRKTETHEVEVFITPTEKRAIRVVAGAWELTESDVLRDMTMPQILTTFNRARQALGIDTPTEPEEEEAA